MSETKSDKLLLAGASLPFTEGLMAMMHGGPIGGIVAIGLSGLVYVVADELEQHGRGISLPRPQRRERQAGQQSILYKLTHGRSYRDAHEDEPDSGSSEEWDEEWYDGEEDIARAESGKFTFSEVLSGGFTPSLSQIYLGRLEDGTPLTVAAKDLCHVALPGATGHGKSSLIRLLMAQLCYCGLPVYLLNPHYMVFDREHDEDWTPFTPYLKADPFVCKDMAAIKKVLDWIVYQLLPSRKERAAKGGRIGKPYFFVLDEVPDIVKAIPGASEQIGKILREGRKYGLYLIVASQDFSVKTLGVEGEGSIRKCFHTILYAGGDPISVRELLNAKSGKVGNLEIDENALGKGPIIARYMAREKAQDALKTVVTSAHSPYTDNESLYSLLGPSTFVAEDEEPEEELAVYASENDKQTDKHPVYTVVNEPVEPSSKIIQGPFINTDVHEYTRAQTPERAPVNDDIRKHIRRMVELGYPHRDISKIVGLYGAKYKLYQQVCTEERIKIDKEVM